MRFSMKVYGFDAILYGMRTYKYIEPSYIVSGYFHEELY